MESFIESLKWRYATKQFDTEQKVSNEDLETLLAGIQLSASSYGLQPYEVLVIEDPEIRGKLKSAAWNQSQITDASHLIVFASYTLVNEEHIENYLENISRIRELPLNTLDGFRGMLQNTILKLSPGEQAIWTSKQAYIALGNFLSAAANLKIDTCPMEGFDTQAFDKILGLQERGLTTAVIAPIGYRSKNDKMQYVPKVRKSKNQLFQFI